MRIVEFFELSRFDCNFYCAKRVKIDKHFFVYQQPVFNYFTTLKYYFVFLFQYLTMLTNEMVSRFALVVLFLVSVNASLTGPMNILPSLPNAIIKSENAQCQHDSLKLQADLKNMTLWAQQSK